MTDHDGDSRSPGVVAGNSALGMSRVRPRRGAHQRAEDDKPERRWPADAGRESRGFEAGTREGWSHERPKAVAVVLLVLVTLAIVAETAGQIAGGVDVLAFAPGELAPFRRIDALLAAVAAHARYVAVATGSIAIVGTGLGALVLVMRSRA
jgi:hypothetical protein